MGQNLSRRQSRKNSGTGRDAKPKAAGRASSTLLATKLTPAPHVAQWVTDLSPLIERMCEQHRNSPYSLERSSRLIAKLAEEWRDELGFLEKSVDGRIPLVQYEPAGFGNTFDVAQLEFHHYLPGGWSKRIDNARASVVAAKGHSDTTFRAAVRHYVDVLRLDYLLPMELLLTALGTVAGELHAKELQPKPSKKKRSTTGKAKKRGRKQTTGMTREEKRIVNAWNGGFGRFTTHADVDRELQLEEGETKRTLNRVAKRGKPKIPTAN